MNNFYIYEHRTEDTGELFYIGKGSGKRANWLYDRNEYHQRITDKHGCVVSIVHDNLSEQEAFELEIKLITEAKLQGLCKANLCYGGKGGIRGVPQSEETRQKRRESMIGKHAKEKNPMFGKVEAMHHNSKKLIAIHTDGRQMKFDSTTQADRVLGISRTRNYAGGRSNHFHQKSGWSFYYEEEFKGGKTN